MGSIFRRKDSKQWWGSYYVNGRRVREGGGPHALRRRALLLRRQLEAAGLGAGGPPVRTASAESEMLGRLGRLFDLKGARSLSPRFSRLVRRLGLVDLHFYDLRHTFATNMRRAGADLFTIGAMTGHASMEMLRRYNTVTAADQHEALNRVKG